MYHVFHTMKQTCLQIKIPSHSNHRSVRHFTSSSNPSLPKSISIVPDNSKNMEAPLVLLISSSLLFLLFYSSSSRSISTNQPHLSKTPPTNPNLLIHTTCHSTSYVDLCISSLESDSNSSTTSDVKGLATILINLAIANATNTSVYASILAKNDADPTTRKVLMSCQGRYSDARDSLVASIDELVSEYYDYAFLRVSAAAEYPKMCRDMFRRWPRLVYPAEMARREDVLTRLCTVTTEIISGLSDS